jgi:cytochrome c oxidase subunit 1
MESTLKNPPGAVDSGDLPDNAQSVLERSTLGLDQEMPPLNYLNADYGIKSWLLTIDHKRIAILYLISISAFFFLGGFAALVVRLNLLTPYSTLIRPDVYNRAFTMHGIMMVFFFLIPAIPAVLGNFLVPIMLGAKDLAFPKLNLLSWYLFIVGGILALAAMLIGGVDTGWTFYAPYSSIYANGYVVLTALGIFLAGFSSILTGLNFIITTHKMRAPGMTWFRMPLFIWSMYATSLIQVLGTPVLAITILLLAVETIFKVGIFEPKLGGDPVLFQHLFWFYSHPAVYIMVLPGMAVISELVTCFSRKPIFGYKFVAFSSLAIAVISFLVWGHHMFVSSQSAYASVIFSVLSFLVAIPSAIKVFNWTATMYKGSIRLDAPMLYTMAFIGLFLIGGLTGLYVAAIAVDLHVTDTYFIVAHFHYVMVGATVSAYLGGIHFWWPKMTGRMYNEIWARIAAATLFIGFNLTFFPQFILGYQGMPRRYAMYAPEFQVLNVCSTLGATVLAVGYLLPFFYLLSSLRNGAIAGPNPWRATGLEWQTTSPPPTFNFDHVPIVKIGPYAYNAAADEAEDARLELRATQQKLEVARANLEAELAARNGNGTNGSHTNDKQKDGVTKEDVHR